MNLAQLRYLIAFADEGTLTRAARVVRTSQPALSLALRALEAELKTTLLVHKGRRLALTADGEAAVAAARRAIAAVDDVKTSVSINRPCRVLTIAVYFPLAMVLSETLNAFSRRWPDIKLRTVQTRTSQKAAELVAAGEVDIGCGEPTMLPATLLFTPYREFEILLISPPGSDLPPALDKKMLAKKPFVSIPDTQYRQRLFEGFFDDVSEWPQIVLEVDDLQSYIAAVRAGIGSALVSRAHCEGLSGVEIRSFSPPYHHTIGFIHGEDISRAAKDFLQTSKILARKAVGDSEQYFVALS